MAATASRELLIVQAKISEECERFEDMAAAMKTRIEKHKDPLTDEERNLLSVAYKNVVGKRRAAWRTVNHVLAKQTTYEEERKRDLTKKTLDRITKEVEKHCAEMLMLLERFLIPRSKDVESQNEATVFYYKMKGDYHRYLAEVKVDNERAAAISDAEDAYQMATKMTDTLPPTHPIRLGLALNYSVFHYELHNDPDKACRFAKQAFDEAIADLGQMNSNDDSYKDSTLIIQLLRDNLTLWSSESQDQQLED